MHRTSPREPKDTGRFTGSHVCPFNGVAMLLMSALVAGIFQLSYSQLTNTAGSTEQRSSLPHIGAHCRAFKQQSQNLVAFGCQTQGYTRRGREGQIILTQPCYQVSLDHACATADAMQNSSNMLLDHDLCSDTAALHSCDDILAHTS